MPTHQEEQALIEKAAAGDSRAFEKLLQPYLNKMKHLLSGYFKHSGEREEAMQEVLIRIFRGLQKFRGDSKFSTWVYTVTSNTARNELDKNRRHYNTDDIDELSCADHSKRHEPDLAETLMSARQQLEDVQRVLAEMPEKMAEALIMREVQNISDEEIARIQGCPMGTVRSRVFRARQILREKLLDADALKSCSPERAIQGINTTDTEEPTMSNPTPITTKNGWTEYRTADGKLHREDGPARIKPNGTQEWHVNGQLHRTDGPAVINSKLTLYYVNDKLHRTDGPAVIGEGREEFWVDGKAHRVDGPAISGPEGTEYRLKGKLHRTDGPAIVVPGVLEAWYVFDMPHRTDGPAIIHADGRTESWVAGKRIDADDI